MPTAASGSNLYLGRGKLYVDRWTAGAASGPGAFRFLGSCDEFEITPSVEKKDRFDATRNTARKLATVNVTQTHMMKITAGEFDPENVALALLGTTAAYTQAATPITGESLTTSAVLGRIYRLAKRLPTAITVKKGATPLVLGTDYDVEDSTMGLIRLLPTSSTIIAGDTLTVDYTPTAISGAGLTRISSGLVSSIDASLVFVGDPANGPAFDAELWHVRFSPAGALAWINNDFANIPLEAEILDDSANHAAAPLYHVTKRV
jgi:hypothetical protein